MSTLFSGDLSRWAIPQVLAVCALLLSIAFGRGGAAWAADIFTLKDCIGMAQEKNPEIRAQRYGHEAAQQERAKARAAYWPFLDAQGTYSRFGEPQRLVPAHANNDPGVFDRDVVDTALIGRVLLFEGGRRAAAVRAAELAMERTLWDLTATMHDVVLNTASVFYKILQSDQVVRATEGSLKALDAQAKLLRDQLDVGRAAPVDLMKIQVRVSSLAQKLSSLRADRQLLLVFLGRFMGLEVEGRPSFDVSGSLEEPQVSRMSQDEALREALGKRPEKKAAQAVVDTASQALRIAQADHWPQVSVFGRYGLRHGLPYDASGSSGGLSHEDTWVAGLQVDVPLFRGGAVQASVQQAKLIKHRAREQLRAVELEIRKDVERALTALNDALERTEVTRSAVAVAEETLRIEREKYAAGKNSVNDVLDAQAALLQAQVEYSQAVVDAHIARMERDRALGRDPAESLR